MKKRLIRHEYSDGKGGYCAIGLMAKAAGVPENVLQMAGDDQIKVWGDIYLAVQRRFPLADLDAQRIIQEANDKTPKFVAGYMKEVGAHEIVEAYLEEGKVPEVKLEAVAA